MKRGITVSALAGLLAAFAVPASQAQEALGPEATLSGDVLVTDTPDGTTRGAESGLGYNGQRIDGRRVVRTSSGPLAAGQCHTFPINPGVWLGLCADDDGCTVRVTSDADSLRASSGPHILVTTADGTGWSVGSGSTTNIAGTNGDGTEKSILGAASSPADGGNWQCQLVDDTPSSMSLALELYVCHNDVPNQGDNMSCTVRFDD